MLVMVSATSTTGHVYTAWCTELASVCNRSQRRLTSTKPSLLALDLEDRL